MVQKDFYMTRKDGVNLYRFYSDKKLKIRQKETGVIYDPDAIDVEDATFTYKETEEKIEEIAEN